MAWNNLTSANNSFILQLHVFVLKFRTDTDSEFTNVLQLVPFPVAVAAYKLQRTLIINPTKHIKIQIYDKLQRFCNF